MLDTLIFVPNPGLGAFRRITQFLLLCYSVRPGLPQRTGQIRFLELSRVRQDYDAMMLVPRSVDPDLRWWLHHLPTAVSPIRRLSFHREIFTDASNKRWVPSGKGRLSEDRGRLPNWNTTSTTRNCWQPSTDYGRLHPFSQDAPCSSESTTQQRWLILTKWVASSFLS